MPYVVLDPLQSNKLRVQPRSVSELQNTNESRQNEQRDDCRYEAMHPHSHSQVIPAEK
jgi:hypothetical protein